MANVKRQLPASIPGHSSRFINHATVFFKTSNVVDALIQHLLPLSNEALALLILGGWLGAALMKLGVWQLSAARCLIP